MINFRFLPRTNAGYTNLSVFDEQGVSIFYSSFIKAENEECHWWKNRYFILTIVTKSPEVGIFFCSSRFSEIKEHLLFDSYKSFLYVSSNFNSQFTSFNETIRPCDQIVVLIWYIYSSSFVHNFFIPALILLKMIVNLDRSIPDSFMMKWFK